MGLYIERNINDNHTAAVLRGEPVVFALISRAVWKAIARAAGPPKAGPEALRVFRGSPVAAGIYGDLTALAGPLGELVAVDDLLARRGLAWAPPADPGQHYSEEMREYLEEARRKYADSPIVLAGLDDYEGEVGELLEDEG